MITSTFLRFASSTYSAFRLSIWRLFYKEKKVVSLKVLKDLSFKFTAFGDIPRILFMEQHLVDVEKSFEYDTLELFRNYLKPDSVVIDIGANIGLFSLLASNYIKDGGKVYAIEPSSSTYSNLVKNISLNNAKNVYPFKIALSNIVGEAKLGIPSNAMEQQFSDSFNRIVDESLSKVASESIEVIECNTLDNFVKENQIQKIDVIKIDVEGAELLCFQGGEKILSSKNKPIIIFECFENHCKDFGHRVFDVLLCLHNYGYECTQFDYFQWVAYPKLVK